MTTNALQAQAAAVEEDQTEDTGGFERRLIPEGPSLARFIGYVEVGKRVQKPYKGKAKADCMEVRFSFELCSERNIFVIGEGEETTTHRDVIGVKITKKSGDRAGFVKLLKKMAYGRPDKLNFGSMLGEPFLIHIVHNTGKARDGSEKVYANMKDSDYNYLIGAPAQSDAITGKTTMLQVPEAINPLRLLLWDNPTQEQWDSLFIDGTRTVTVDGKEVEESKNWLQRDIVTATIGFEGSPLHQMLSGLTEEATPMAGDVVEKTNTDADGQPNPEPIQTTVAPANMMETPAPTFGNKVGPLPEPVSEINTPPAEDAQAKAQAIFDKLGV